MIREWREFGASRIQRKLADAILGPGEWSTWYSKWDSMELQQLPWAYSCLMDREDVTDRLGEIKCPALVIHGTQDKSIALEKARIVQSQLGGKSRLVEVEGGTHAVNISHSEIVNEEILLFLESLKHSNYASQYKVQ
jgi:pimeloyl-ACP methyl ester carboxylesterase